MESLETKVVPDSEDANYPFFSPDGQWVGFFAGGKLKKGFHQRWTAGSPGRCSREVGAGSWGENGTIVFTPAARGTGLSQVSAEGGTPQPITMLDSDEGETSHRLPHLLPGGEAVLFTAYGATFEDVQIIAPIVADGPAESPDRGGQPSPLRTLRASALCPAQDGGNAHGGPL